MADEFVLSDKIVYGEYGDKDGFITHCYLIETEDVKEFIRQLKLEGAKCKCLADWRATIDKLAGTLGGKMMYKIRFYNPNKKKWEIWKNAYHNEVFDFDKERLKNQFESTASFKQFKLKYKIIEEEIKAGGQDGE